MKTNQKKISTRTTRPSTLTPTYEGGPAIQTEGEVALRRVLLTALLGEDTFYEDGQSVKDRILELGKQVDPGVVVELIREARQKLRHAPLWLTLALLGKPEFAEAVDAAVQRGDEPAELIAMYWKDGKKPLPNALKKALARKLVGFSEYQLAKYKGEKNTISLRDVIRLVHPRPENEGQSATFKKVVDGTLKQFDTWESELSAGGDKKEVFTRLLTENKLGGLALLRNLRNMKESGVAPTLIRQALVDMNPERVLPFRFIAAARAVPEFAAMLEGPMMRALKSREVLKGHTVLLVDVSGSMLDQLSSKSDLRRIDAAAALAVLAREVCEKVTIHVFTTQVYPPVDKHGMDLANYIIQHPGGGTEVWRALRHADNLKADRIVCITDEQSSDAGLPPLTLTYVVNVAGYKNSIVYGGSMVSISGWSEALIDFITEAEKLND